MGYAVTAATIVILILWISNILSNSVSNSIGCEAASIFKILFIPSHSSPVPAGMGIDGMGWDY